MRRITFSLVVCALAAAGALQAQSPGVPRLVPASGMLIDQAGKPLDGDNIKIMFAVYADAGDQEPLWSETVKVRVAAGRYDALIGSSSPDGIPSSVFAAGEARWLGITADKAVAPPRALLVSVPYALTADDSAKLGGHPASAFVLKSDPGATKSPSSSTPSGWKQAIDEEATTRAGADTTLQGHLDGAKSELNIKIDGTKGELTGKIDATRTELNTKIDVTKNELDTKINATKSELTGKILFETAKLTTEQESKLQALKNELQSESSQKVGELEQKKTSKEEFEQEKSKKQLELEDIKQKKLSKEEYLLEKQLKDADIIDLKQKKLDRLDFEAEKAAKAAALLNLDARKLEKVTFDAEKVAKDLAVKDLDDRVKELKAKSDSLSEFVVSFAREANGDVEGAAVCIGSHVAVGLAVGVADDLATAAPQCAGVTGATVRADGILIGLLSDIVAMPGLQQIPPAGELACPAGHVVVGLNVEGGNLYAACRRLFSNTPLVNSQASVPAGTQATHMCAATQSVVGLRKAGGAIEVVCR